MSRLYVTMSLIQVSSISNSSLIKYVLLSCTEAKLREMIFGLMITRYDQTFKMYVWLELAGQKLKMAIFVIVLGLNISNF